MVGMPAQPEKAKVLHHLKDCFQPLTPTNEPVANAVDDNVQLYVLSPTLDNFQSVAEMVSDRLANHQESYLLQIHQKKSQLSSLCTYNVKHRKLLMSDLKT